MTVESQVNKTEAMVMGSSATYDFSFHVLLNDPTENEAKQAIKVSISDGETTTQLEYGTDYTVSLNDDGNGGTVTVADMKTSDYSLIIYREYDFKQGSDYQNYNSFPADTLEGNLDKNVMVAQQLNEKLDRAVLLDMFSTSSPNEYAAKIEALYDIRNEIVTDAQISAAITDVSGNKTNINAVAANKTNINAAVANETNINAAVANATNINAAVANESNINTAVSNMAAIIDAPNQASAAAASATLAQDWATKMDGQVESTDYSSKYYAGQAAGSAQQAAISAQQAAISAAGTHFKLFQHQWFDYEVNDMAWLRADTFSWQDGTVYSNAYDHLVADIDGVTASTETVGGYTVTFYRATDGHKIVLADQETTVGNIYTATGVAWYYVLDTANNRFKLPRTKYGFDGLRDNVGDYIPESLPNITGNTGISKPANTSYNGAFSGGSSATVASLGTQTTTSNLDFDASRSSSAYQNSAPVQQRGTQMYLYFYVGQYTQSATEQTAGLNAELFNNKADIDASNFNADGKSLLSGLGMPSGRYIDLTLGASGISYTAPANGYFSLLKGTTAAGQYIIFNSFFGEATQHLCSMAFSPGPGYGVGSFIPVRKGDQIHISYTAAGAVTYFRFVYAEGEN